MNEVKTQNNVCSFCGTGYLKGLEGKVYDFDLDEVEGDSEKNLKVCGECLARLPEIKLEAGEERISEIWLENFKGLEVEEGKLYKIELGCYRCSQKGMFLILFENGIPFVSRRDVSFERMHRDEVLNYQYQIILCENCESNFFYYCDCGTFLDEESVVVLEDGETCCPNCYLEAMLKDPPKVHRTKLTFEIVRKSVNFSEQYVTEEAFRTKIQKFGWELGNGMKTWSSFDGSELNQFNRDDLAIEVKDMLEKGYEYMPILVAVHQFCVNVQIIYRKRR